MITAADVTDAQPGLTLQPAESIHEQLFDLGLTDGLPVVAPTPDLVADMLNAGPWSPDHVLIDERTREIQVTAHLAAVNAVLAGARPEYFPVIGAALIAMGDSSFRLHMPTASTGGATIMVIVTGPIAAEIGINGRENLFGPGFRANATIGRTIRLIQMNVLAAVPGELDKSTQGWPGKFSLCFTENTEASPWDPLHERLGLSDRSGVTVFASESGHNICSHGTSDPEALLLTFADAMAALGSFSNGRSVVVFAPEHARKIGEAGWSVSQVQEFLYTHAARDLATLKRVGKIEHEPTYKNDWASGRWQPKGDQQVMPGDETTIVHRGYRPDDIMVLVGGGEAGGHSAFFPSWSRQRSCPFITEEVPSHVDL